MHQVLVEKTSTIPLPDLIDSAINGDEVIFTQDDLPVAKLVAMNGKKPRPQFGSAKGMFVMAPDFNDPIDDFDEYRK